MKKLINRPGHVVEEMIQGLVAADAGLARLSSYTVVLRSNAASSRDKHVALISGGGSGHEPAHAGYVGEGMLTAAVAGEIFTSPPSDSVYHAIKAVGGKAGVLLIIKNYTGDRLNFGVAAEMARAEGIPVETVVVADDVALLHLQQATGARGLAGTVFVHKIAGAAAEQGRDLAEVARVAQKVATSVATMGVSLSAGTNPAVGKPSYTLEEDEVELGLGIHGEPGVRRTKLPSADELAGSLVDSIVNAQSLEAGKRVAVMVNNLGITTPMELAIFTRAALDSLEKHKVVAERVYSGTFMSSLDAAGVSISLLRVDDDLLGLLDAPTNAAGWLNSAKERPTPLTERTLPTTQRPVRPNQQSPRTPAGKAMERALRSACQALLAAETRLTEMDRLVGDGDLGISLARGGRAIEAEMPTYPFDDGSATLSELAVTLQHALAGSSGPLYGVLLLRAAQTLRSANRLDGAAWAEATVEACDAISQLGGAKLGDRTMLDALIPFAQAFRQAMNDGEGAIEAIRVAVTEAERSAEGTANLLPRRGRSTYLAERALGHPDPGAIAVTVWLRAVADAMAGSGDGYSYG
jgi:dihydroxyacetone kinase